MKTLILVLTILSCLSINGTISNAQPITISGSTGADGNYTSLTLAGGAFNVLNSAGSQAGNNIVITISGDVLTETGFYSLSSNNWVTLTIKPSGGVQRIISGTIAGGGLIKLSSVNNVTIDGLNTGGNKLTFENLSTSLTAGTSTIALNGNSSNNVITNCMVLGSSTVAIATDGGNIFIVGDNNTISNCDIGPSSAGLPTKCVYLESSDGNVITGNNIYDFFSPTIHSSGIWAGVGAATGTFSNNKFYQTAARTITGSNVINSCIATGNGVSYEITGNTIGFSSNTGTGLYTISLSSSSEFYPIYIQGLSSTVNSIQGNTVTGLAVSGNNSGIPFCAAYIQGGIVNFGNIIGNTIGSLSGASNITYTNSSTSSPDIAGCYVTGGGSPAVCNFSNNSFGNIIVNSSSAVELYGIYFEDWAGSTINNIIGSEDGPIINNSTQPSSRVAGIRYNEPGTEIKGNIIRNLSMSAANTGTGISTSVIGILHNSTAASTGNLISQNTIQNLSNTNSSSAVKVAGIVYNGSTSGTHLIERNKIHSLNISSSNASATLSGIIIVGGSATYQNNMISLGLDGSASSPISNGVIINGISESGTNSFSNLYFNSIYIGGSDVTGTANTFAFQSTTTTNTRNYVNNIFWNARSNGTGTGKHYAMRVGGTTPNPTGLTTNYNDLYVSGTGGVLGLFNAIDQSTLSAWQTATGQDANSSSVEANFVSPATGDLHFEGTSIGNTDFVGTPIAGITTDIDNDSRDPLYPYMGADEGDEALPVEISSLTSSINGRDITLSWTTSSETNNSEFDIERSNINSQSSNEWNKVGNVKGNGTTSNSHNYSFTDKNLQSGKYNYRLKQIDFNGNFTYYNLNHEVIVGIPAKFELSQNYPNPYNPATKINYDLPFDSKVSIKLFDMTGREVAVMVNEVKTAGYYTIDFNAANLSSGVYFYKIQAGDFSIVKRMVLTK